MKTRHYLQSLVIVTIFTIVACKKEDDSKKEETPTTTDSKSLALKDFNEMYVAADVASFTWNGNAANCNAGTLPQEVIDKALLRLKYFRKAAGLPNDGIVMNAVSSAKSQKHALMTVANNKLSHFPDTTWKCYSADGAEAAQKANIAFGVSDVENINLWIQDEGSNNMEIGHRRWMLYSRATEFGFGATNTSGTLWCINGWTANNPLPANTPDYVAWPPKGFIPRDVVYPRWSLSIPAPSHPFQVDFTNATVEMTNASGVKIPLTIEYANPIQSSYGDNTIVWRPSGINLTSNDDQKYTVKVANVKVSGVTKNYEYDVTIFKP